jgi:hypothetical protein
MLVFSYKILLLIFMFNYFLSNIDPNNNSPLDQFIIRDLISLDLLGSLNLSLTNIGLYLVVSSVIITLLYLASNNYGFVVSNN